MSEENTNTGEITWEVFDISISEKQYCTHTARRPARMILGGTEISGFSELTIASASGKSSFTPMILEISIDREHDI